MYNSRNTRERGVELSSLAQGRGFYRHGVQVECFIDDKKAYTLHGQPFLKPCSSGTGNSSKPYRSHKLNLSKTYVTKRGQMVLFTAPEDMVMGKSCAIHRKPLNANQVASELKTTKQFTESAITYENSHPQPFDIVGSKVEEGAWQGAKGAWQDHREVKAGHFTDVYLRSLRKATDATRSKVSQECTVEDLEVKGGQVGDLLVDMETQPIPECDSGLGQSIGPSPSGRLSSLSHHSISSTVISIPHGSVLNEERPPLAEMTPQGDQMSPRGDASTTGADDDELDILKRELSLYKAKEVAVKDAKKHPKTGKKRQHPKSNIPLSSSASDHAHSQDTPTTKVKSMKASKTGSKAQENLSSSKPDQPRSVHSKPPKGRKRRGRKAPDDDSGRGLGEEGPGEDPAMDVGTSDDKDREASMTGDGCGSEDRDPLELTAVQIQTNGEGVADPVPAKSRRGSVAEDRRLEVERKRKEKRELERQKRFEEEERQRLKEELEIANAQRISESEEVEVQDAKATPPETPSPPSNTTSFNQQQLLDALERAKMRENRLLLSLRGETSDQMLTEELRSVEEAVERAHRAAEELERKREEEERRRHEEEELRRAEEEKKRLEEEAVQTALAERAQAIEARAARLKEECTLAAKKEKKERYQDTMAQSIMFSYFSFLPPPTTRKPTDKRTQRGKRPQTIRSK